MENKKLLKFLLKDIAEIEELFSEKGSSGFDDYELEFLQSRFKGAKQIVQILQDKEAKNTGQIHPVEQQEKVSLTEIQNEEPKEELQETGQKEVSEENIAEENKEPEIEQKFEEHAAVEATEAVSAEEEVMEDSDAAVHEKTESITGSKEPAAEEQNEAEIKGEPEPEVTPDESASYASEDMELEEDQEEPANRTLGDSFLKEKSVNDLMGNGYGKLEAKLSNSPVHSIQGAIGINDRYQYIRELFNGDADTFVKTVTDLDKLNNIQEAVNYLQQNYKWKKNETSLKFVNLVKRRFLNG
jgi:hypothetical protein